jgi:hypothetical protein
MKKGVIEPAAAFLISAVLLIAFLIGAYIFLFTDTGPKTVEALNSFMGSKLGIVINPAKFGELTQTTSLSAKITAEPPSPVCTFEPVYFSANNTNLPKDITWSDVNCYWDFDIALEPCDYYTNASDVPPNLHCTSGLVSNNSNTEDDYTATTCSAISNGPWPGTDTAANGKKNSVGLIVVAGGKTSIAKTLVKSTLSCACSGVSPGCYDEPGVSPSLPATLSNSQTLNVSFNEIWNLAGIHFVIEPVGNVSKLVVGTDAGRVYEFAGNLSNPAIVYGQSLIYSIEQQRGTCKQNGIDPCPISFTFYFGGSGIRIKEIWIPLN